MKSLEKATADYEKAKEKMEASKARYEADLKRFKAAEIAKTEAENLEDYLSFDKIICCGGSWMVKGELVKNGEFDKIRDLTAEARKLVDSIRK